MNGKLMEIDLKEGLLKVNFSERLVLLIREGRQLLEIGYKK
jgi:dynein heavy chain 2